MLKSFRHKSVAALLAIALLLFANAARARSPDIRILEKALVNALGEKSNFGTERLITLREELREGEKTLLVGVVANNSPTVAGMRHGIFTDVVRILRVLKSWRWHNRVARVMIAEYLPEARGPDVEARAVMTCALSSEKVRDLDWNSFDPRRVPEVVDVMRLDDSLKQQPN